MEQTATQSTNWSDGDVTAATGISVSAMVEEVPTLTVATIVGVTVVVLVAIAAVFLLGILLDCRQKKLLEQKMGQVRRKKPNRRVNVPVEDKINIADNMESPDLSQPPAHTLQEIP